MRLQQLLLIVLLVLTPPTRAEDGTVYKATPGPRKVELIEEVWRDDARPSESGSRVVPVRVYVPCVEPAEGESARLPVVIFSHGYGGSRSGYEYFGRHLASHGYLVVHPQHAGSDISAVRELAKKSREEFSSDRRGDGGSRVARVAAILQEGTSDPENLANRPLDVRFVIDRIGMHERLAGVAELSRVAVAGHSFGSYTAMAVAGMRVHVHQAESGSPRSFKDERVKVIIAMSPQGSGMMGVGDNGWDAVNIPALLMTGSKDMGQGNRAVSWRLEPFEKLKHSGTKLLYIDEAAHVTFSGETTPVGIARSSPRETVDRHVGFIKQTCTAFLDAHLRDDRAARQWLADRQIEKVSKGECQLRGKE